jgi:hypothetical protein
MPTLGMPVAESDHVEELSLQVATDRTFVENCITLLSTFMGACVNPQDFLTAVL